MHVIAFGRLREFFEEHPDAEASLRSWHHQAEEAQWETPNEVRETYATASFVGKYAVFNIGGNKYRLITDIHYNRGKVFIHRILTHAEYDLKNWQQD